MSKALAKGTAVRKPFVWRTQDGERLTPQEMSTPHLFYTLRMIWNHFMPEDARIEPYKRYGINMTQDYLEQAIVSIGEELSTREDLAMHYRMQLIFMKNYLDGITNPGITNPEDAPALTWKTPL